METPTGQKRPIFPSDIWLSIIPLLPTTDKKTCLFVSKLHHDLAIAKLFSHLTLSFGLWHPHPDRNISEAEEKRRTRRSFEILQHIIETPKFANVVRKLSVHAYADKKSRFKRDLLMKALKVFQSLHAFAWHGSDPMPSTEVMETILASSGSTIRELCLPVELSETFARLPEFNRLLYLAFVSKGSDGCTLDVALPQSVAQQTLRANTPSLRRLCTYGHIIVGGDLQPLSNLQELSIVAPEGRVFGLDTVFTHCTRLRAFSLIMLSVDDSPSEELLQVLRAHPTALPLLESFKLSCLRYSGDSIDTVLAFLSQKASLRRLDIINEMWDGAPYRNLLEGLSRLPHLEVLGFDIRCDEVTQEHLHLLDGLLPHALTALYLSVSAETVSVPMDEWLEMFNHRPSLRYVHVVSDSQAFDFDMKEVWLKTPPRSAELLGCGSDLHWISRGETGTDAAVNVSERWPYWRVHLRTVDDFRGEEDWEWLLRHHGGDGVDDFPWGDEYEWDEGDSEDAEGDGNEDDDDELEKDGGEDGDGADEGEDDENDDENDDEDDDDQELE